VFLETTYQILKEDRKYYDIYLEKSVGQNS